MRNALPIALLSLALLAACADSESGNGSAMDGFSGSGGDGDNDTTGFKPVPCPEDLEEFSLGLEATGEDKLFKVNLVDASPAPPEKFLNDWIVEVTDMDGDPVEDATFPETPQSFMPVHGHDGARPIEWDAMDEPGQFDVRMINMWMGGPWEVRFWIEDDAGNEDYAVFTVCIED